MNQEVVSAVGDDRHPSVRDLRQRADLLELLSEVDSRIHRVMERFIGAGERAKSEIGTMIDEAIDARAAEDEAGRELEALRSQVQAARASPQPPVNVQQPRRLRWSRTCACNPRRAFRRYGRLWSSFTRLSRAFPTSERSSRTRRGDATRPCDGTWTRKLSTSDLPRARCQG